MKAPENTADERLMAEVAELLRNMDRRQVQAVHSFAVHLKVGAVQPLFSVWIDGGREDREDSA